jgi:hypothetical protein
MLSSFVNEPPFYLGSVTLTLMRWTIALLLASVLYAQEPVQSQETPMFGVSVFVPGGLTGQIYAIKENTQELPNFKNLKPIGTIYTHSLLVLPRDFTEGFPGLPDRFEWFAIDYTGRFWVSDPGEYRFILTSDDGSNLYIDGKRIIDNDGIHPPLSIDGKVKLKVGVHSIRVSYFQGPRFHVALVLQVIPPDGMLRVFSTLEFKPPPDLENIDEIPH